jgi:hypothetical protein
MIDVDKTRAVLDQIALSKDPVRFMSELVLDGGGTWVDTATVDTACLFKVNLHGVRGFSLGATAAIDNWMANANERKNNQCRYQVRLVLALSTAYRNRF